jgi:protocatechuate 3,4-dioxygenase beta subunit
MGVHDHDRGLAFDMARLLDRRAMLGVLGGAVLIGTVGCGGDDERPAARPSGTATPTRPDGTATTRGEIPDETAGPFPGDGTNGPNVLDQSGIVRSDIRSSFGGSSRIAQGVPLTIEFDVTNNGAAYQGAAVYVWQSDRDGNYSMYSEEIRDENYLRGVQTAGTNGVVRFTTIFPAAYPGRWPHVHFEVYDSLTAATRGSRSVKTSQLAFPKDACAAIYATSGYEASRANLSGLSLDSDSVFRDGYASQLATVTGNASNGYTAKLAVPI